MVFTLNDNLQVVFTSKTCILAVSLAFFFKNLEKTSWNLVFSLWQIRLRTRHVN